MNHVHERLPLRLEQLAKPGVCVLCNFPEAVVHSLPQLTATLSQEEAAQVLEEVLGDVVDAKKVLVCRPHSVVLHPDKSGLDLVVVVAKDHTGRREQVLADAFEDPLEGKRGLILQECVREDDRLAGGGDRRDHAELPAVEVRPPRGVKEKDIVRTSDCPLLCATGKCHVHPRHTNRVQVMVQKVRETLILLPLLQCAK